MMSFSKFILLLAISGSCVDADDFFWNPFAHFPDDLPVKSTRIVNGVKSNPSNRPFFAKAGYDKYYFTNEILCGATVIWSDIIITAAHCQGAFNSGALILDPNTNDYTRLVPIDRQIRHPGWSISRQQLNHDVLVMRLETPLSTTDVAKPIPINKNANYPSNSQALKAYGFGLTENEVVSDYLREADVTYISNDDCWGRGISFNNVLKSDEVMCTDPYENEKTTTCLGDSGGPLTDTSGSTLVGIISFGSGCKADQIPDGHVRLSEVHDWVQEQICLLSANPPTDCDFSEPRDPRVVEVVIDFTHDFFPEHTTFAVRSKKTLETVYAGPEYIPTRNGIHKESVFLLPGEYTFDLFDTEGNGLASSYGDGSWKLSALYDGVTKTDVADGSADFKDQQVTKFVISEGTIDTAPTPDNISDVTDVISENLNKCLSERDGEMVIGNMYSTTCDCAPSATSDAFVLSCTDANGESCAHNYQSCDSSSDCCNGGRCRNGKCRSSAPKTGSREDKRLGNMEVGGAAARSARNPGKLRRR